MPPQEWYTSDLPNLTDLIFEPDGQLGDLGLALRRPDLDVLQLLPLCLQGFLQRVFSSQLRF